MYMQAEQKRKGAGSHGSHASLLQNYYGVGTHARKTSSRQRVRKNQPKPVQKIAAPKPQPVAKPVTKPVAKPVEEEEDHDENIAMLSNDFILMLDCSPQPDEVFCHESRELGLACMWLNKMISWRCNTLYDLRMRNAYMSHLIVCLNRRQLTGIFREPPPQELVWVDFEERSSNLHPPPLVVNPMALACTAWMQGTLSNSCPLPCCSKSLGSASRPPCHCGGPNVSGSCCSNHRHLGGSIIPNPLMETSTDDKEIQEILSVKRVYSSCGSQRSLRQTRSQSSPGRLTPSKAKANSFIKSEEPKDSPKGDPSSLSQEQAEAVRENMLKLLLIIKKELSGDQGVEWNQYLETELRRYRDFAEEHKDEDDDWVACKDQKSERFYLLLNMQKDLVRMLIEEGVKIPN
ncbi:uncharacterized protein [Drosophila kikkawai]|uniref:DUF4485 domain-containing protein n=1 Tax=Drosophila kikkawai TaxID=30033 RepID=A0A6P4I491_DROKI|nr:uncharacterized protein LOC108075164 [Drosophila kikkawai]